MEDKTHRLIRYLNDTHATEIGGIAALKDLLARTNDSEVRAAVTDKLAVGQTQVQRLETRIRELGGSVSPAKAAASAAAKGSRLMNVFHDQEDKQTQDLVKAYALTHFEIGVYTSLIAYAEAIGDTETTRLAQTIRGEERTAAERFERLIPRLAVQAVNRTQEAGRSGTADGGSSRLSTPVLVAAGTAALLAVWGITRRQGDGDAGI